jgi:arabinose-5-phosphate isomerase
MRDAIMPIAEQRGTVAIVDENCHVLGVVTAGDLSRLMERDDDFQRVRVADVMVRTPKVIRAGELASAAVYQMERHGIMAMPVLQDDGDRMVGIIHLHDLMRARVV